MSPVSIAILGAGLFAKEAHIPAIAALGDKATLSAIYSRSLSSAEDLAAVAKEKLNLDHDIPLYHDADPAANLAALFARPDIHAVAVVLPITVQPSIILQALAAGKHVLSEKPIAPDVVAGTELIMEYEAKYAQRGLVWRVAENFECEPVYRTAGKVLAQGKIGDLAFFGLNVVNALDQSSKWYKTPWRTVPDYQGGFLLDGGVHFAALLRTVLGLAGERISALSAFSTLTKSFLAPSDSIHAALLTAPSGKSGTLEVTFAAPAESRAEFRATITGTRGWLKMESGKLTVHSVKASQTKDTPPEETVEVIEVPTSAGVREEFRSFVERVGGGVEDGLGSPRGALRDVAIVEAALSSKGELVSIDDLVGGF